MGTQTGRRGTIRLVRASLSAPLDDDTQIHRVDLSDGVLGRWLCLDGVSELQITTRVPEQQVVPTARHLQTHGSAALADALGLLTCERDSCPYARTWFSAAPTTVAAAGC